MITADKLDIRGTWLFTVTGLNPTSFSMQFSGMTSTSGTVSVIGYSNTGTYTADHENVDFTITGPINFTGKFENSNKMSGTHTSGAETWSATRSTTAAATPAVSKTIVPLKTR